MDIEMSPMLIHDSSGHRKAKGEVLRIYLSFPHFTIKGNRGHVRQQREKNVVFSSRNFDTVRVSGKMGKVG